MLELLDKAINGYTHRIRLFIRMNWSCIDVFSWDFISTERIESIKVMNNARTFGCYGYNKALIIDVQFTSDQILTPAIDMIIRVSIWEEMTGIWAFSDDKIDHIRLNNASHEQA